MPTSAYGTYQVIPAPGGAWHVYPGGRRVFVRAHAATPAAPAAPVAAPETQQQAVQAYQQPPAEAAPDAQYYTDQAQRLFRKQQQLTGLDTQATRDRTAMDEALRQMSQQQPLQEGTAKTGANRAGLFYSTALGNQLGQIAQTYAQRRGQAQTRFAESETARAAARAAIEQGYTLDDAAAKAASIDRQITRDTSAADTGALVSEVAPAPTTVAAVAPPAAPRPKLPTVRPRVVRVQRQPTTRALRRPRRR